MRIIGMVGWGPKGIFWTYPKEISGSKKLRKKEKGLGRGRLGWLIKQVERGEGRTKNNMQKPCRGSEHG